MEAPEPELGLEQIVGAVNCVKDPQRPHQSKFEPGIVKVKIGYVCEPTTTPIVLTLTVELQKQTLFFFYSTVGTSTPQTRTVGATGARWNPNTLSASAPCVDGAYRAKLIRQASTTDGVVIGSGVDTFPGYPVVCNRSVGMIIDDTGSMAGEINAVKSALAGFINSREEEEYVLWQLTSFKDSVRNFGTTTDSGTILSWVNGLFASGGGDCPEQVLGGIQSSIGTLSAYPDHAKTLIVATDASAQSGDVESIIASARANNVKVNVLLTGDCGRPTASSSTTVSTTSAGLTPQFHFSLSSQVVLKRIAQETGGKYFYLPGGSQADFEAALEVIFASVDEPDSADTTPPTLTVSATPEVLWPPDHKMREISVTVEVSDDTDPSPLVELVGVESTEPFNGQGDGATPDDIMVSEDGRIYVRAERSGSGNGRVYTISYRATDAAGNVGFGSAEVFVPRDRRR